MRKKETNKNNKENSYNFVLKKIVEKTKLKKIKYASLGLLSIPLVVSCVSVPIIITNHNGGKHLNYKNLFSTFDNIMDNLISLGIAPDYHTMSNSGKTKYASYLENYVNDNITKYVNITIRNGKEVDRNAVNELHADTVILNENMKALTSKFDNIVNNISYSSRGDSAQARYTESMIEGGYNWTSQNSTDNALLIQASGLDSIYDPIGQQFTKKAKNIIEKNNQRISYIYENNKEKLNYKTIGIIYSNTTDAAQIDKEFYICSPYVYPMLYADGDKGIGMDFPTPKETAFINDTHGYYDTSWRIFASSGTELITQFENKFDYLIYCAPDISPSITKQTLHNSEIKKMLRSQDDLNSNLIFSSMGEWYTPAWATIGKNYVLNNIVSLLNLTDISESKKWIPTSPNELRRILEF